MRDYKVNVKEYLEGHRLKMVLVIIALTLLNAVISLLFQKMSVPLLAILPVSAISYYYLVQMYHYVNRIVNHQDTSIKSFFENFKLHRKVFIVIASYIGWALLSFLLLKAIASNPKHAPLAILAMLIMFVLSNAVNHVYYFSKDSFRYQDAIFFSLREYKVLGFSILRTLVTMIQGALLTISVNVFVYGPQIVELLKLDEQASTLGLKKLFASDVSNIIQSAGVQAVIFYTLYTSAVIYAAYTKEKKIKDTSK